jgi:hypothetical protein
MARSLSTRSTKVASWDEMPHFDMLVVIGFFYPHPGFAQK